MCSTMSPQGICAVFKKPNLPWNEKAKLILALDNIQGLFRQVLIYLFWYFNVFAFQKKKKKKQQSCIDSNILYHSRKNIYEYHFILYICGGNIYIIDPGNMGTLIRSASLFGCGGVVTINGCDVFNPKVVR